MFSNSLKMIHTGRNMSQLWQIECKKCNFNIRAFVSVIVWTVYYSMDMNKVKIT
jgi:hypothetical protein